MGVLEESQSGLVPLPESARALSHWAISQVVKPGEQVVDATAGNGYDTLFLAKQVGELGRVFSFDVQQLALTRTREKLEEQALDGRCQLILDSHEHLTRHVQAPVAACMFNLGYLPAGDRAVKTLWPSTQKAIVSALSLLRPGGRVSICAYPGHTEGRQEAEALTEWLKTLREAEYTALHLVFANQTENAPQWFVIERK
ncbi:MULTISPECIES: class I SAM-dependent methyltransferase [unclassified Clostridium]|uniref:tRNA (mnm(5)s(2)U34)-methyltransferase n=1 Tax=unclassified Clostridium TaxID=2614128 RepID=UPI001105DCC1|nr:MULTISPECIES: class I SAM-dependent methyltransferase [unclassified Clostridium]